MLKKKVAEHLSRGNYSNTFHHPIPLHPPDLIPPGRATPFRVDIRESGPCDRRHGVSVPKRSSPEQQHGGTGQHYLHQWPGGRRRQNLTGHNVIGPQATLQRSRHEVTYTSKECFEDVAPEVFVRAVMEASCHGSRPKIAWQDVHIRVGDVLRVVGLEWRT